MFLLPEEATIFVQIMAYESGFNEDLVIELKFLVEVVGEERDEVDSLSKQVIDLEGGVLLPRYIVHKSFFPQREAPLEFHGREERTKRLKKVSEKLLQSFRKKNCDLHSGVLALFTSEQPLDDDKLTRLPLLLTNICHTGVFTILHYKHSHAVVHMDSQDAFTVVGRKIVEESGLNVIDDKRIMCLEALCVDNVPNYFLEMSTSRARGQEIQRQLSSALVTYCGAFKYLRLREEDDEPSSEPREQRPPYPSVSLTLMFSKLAQGNEARLEEKLKSEDSSWRNCQTPDIVCAQNEQLFALKDHGGPLLGLKSGCPLPGVRISLTFSQKLEEMENFYQVVTGVNPAPREDPKTGTSYRIYPIARNFELQLVYNSAVQAEKVKNLRICLRIANHQGIIADLHQSLTFIDADHWETCDPVGNRVLLFNVLD